jgi:hypothetical protein
MQEVQRVTSILLLDLPTRIDRASQHHSETKHSLLQCQGTPLSTIMTCFVADLDGAQLGC